MSLPQRYLECPVLPQAERIGRHLNSKQAPEPSQFLNPLCWERQTAVEEQNETEQESRWTAVLGATVRRAHLGKPQPPVPPD